ncbi:MAG TPA: hypothetical protein VH682_15050 [Gemmataceae bacterium]
MPRKRKRKKRKRRSFERPLLYVEQILAWADEHHQRTGRWPNRDSGPIAGTLNETWGNVNAALHRGGRGLRSGSSVARLLAEHRGVRNFKALPPLAIAQILSWADAYHQRNGSWPSRHAGPIAEAPGDTWLVVDTALRVGLRGLAGGNSLARLLQAHRGVRNPQNTPRLSVERILAWADAHHRRTGRWPKHNSGPIEDAPGETWLAVSTALRHSMRGLREISSSLSQLLAEHRGVRNHAALPRFTLQRILEWADTHYRRTGTWPKYTSGPIVDAPGETWSMVNAALEQGTRGLPPGSSLAQLLAEQRGRRNIQRLPRLTYPGILEWADTHYRRTGTWPTRSSGPILEAPGETWSAVNAGLQQGRRGLPPGSSLAQLLQKHAKDGTV